MQLVACGAGGGSGSTSANALVISGVAATGAPIGAATIRVKCGNGNSNVSTATTLTDANGNYSVTISDDAGITMPCMVEVQINDSTGTIIETLHGLATNTTSTGLAHANITPLTESILATGLGQEDVATYFDALTNSQMNGLKALDTTTLWAAIKTQLNVKGIDTSAITTDPLLQTFTANGAGYDLVLDNIKTKGYTTEHLYRMGKGLPLPPTSATGNLNDSGLDWCSENITVLSWVNLTICSTVNWVGNLWGQQQDAFSGRDAQARAGALQKIYSGMAGFDFTKLGSSGKPLKIQNASWSDSGDERSGTKWDCIRDNNTGLFWEVKRNELINGIKHLHHQDHRYAWYDPLSATNGGLSGYETPTQYLLSGGSVEPVNAPSCSGVADINKCNTQSFVAMVNSVGFCGFKDWRVPSIDELESIVHLGRSGTTIDTDYFPDTPNDWMWSASPYANDADRAWALFFDRGYSYSSLKSNANFLRLVRSGQ